MGRLILMRHGESTLNKAKCFYGSLNPELTDEGIEQCKQTREILKQYDYDILYSSDYVRAKKSAEIVNYKNLEIIEQIELREKNFGVFEGLTFDEILEKYPDEAKKWFEDTDNYNYQTGESTIEFYERLTSFVNNTLELDKNILIVAHWGVVNVLLSYYLMGDRSAVKKFDIKNAGIAVLNFYEKDCVLSALI